MRFFSVLCWTLLFGCVLLARAQNPACSSLIATTTTPLDGAIKDDVIWSQDKQTLFFVTQSADGRTGSLYRSTNGGYTWSNENSKMAGADEIWDLEGKPASGIYLIHPSASPTTFYFEGWGPRMWVTKDMGETYEAIYLGEQYSIEYVLPHPTREDWLLGMVYTSCCWTNSCDSGFCSADLILFRGWGIESGVTIRKYVEQRSATSFGWGKAGYDGYNEASLYVINAQVSRVDQRTLPNDAYTLEFIENALDSNSRTYTVDSVFGFVFVNESNTIIAGQYTNFGARIVTSTDNLASITSIDFPNAPGVTAIAESGYSFLDVEKGTVFIGVLGNTQTGGTRTDLYSSDQFTDNFRLVLEYVAWEDDVEFGKVSGIDGLYIANRYRNGGRQTMITFNQGGSWSPLKTVEPMCQGCSLNLHAPSSTVKDHFYSRPTAPGLIIATGNVGLTLNTEQSAANTYFSRDAGLTWSLLSTGSQLVGFSNFGSLILMVDDYVTVDRVQFSIDQGGNFESCSLVDNTTNIALTAHRIYTEPTTTQTNFLLLTSYIDATDQKERFTLFGLNFTSYFSRQCTGLAAPDTDSSDYETFNPQGTEDSCILGLDTTYVRRKPGTNCYVPLTEQLVTKSRVCDCTMADWVCAPCYRYVAASQTCELYCPVDPNVPADCQGTYIPTTYGYQKNAATQCVNGLDLLPGPNAEAVQCPLIVETPNILTPGDPMNDSAGAIIAIIFIIVGGIVFLVGLAFVIVYVVRRKRLAASNAGPISNAKPRESSTQDGVHNPYGVQLDESEM